MTHVRLLISLALVLSVSSAYAGGDTVVPWTEASFTTTMPAPYGRVQLLLKVEADGGLADVKVTSDGGSPLPVPPVAWSEVTQARIGQVRMSFKQAFDGTPWMYVHIPYGTPIKVRGGHLEWPELVIAFRGARPVYRALNIPKPAGGFDWLPTDLPRG